MLQVLTPIVGPGCDYKAVAIIKSCMVWSWKPDCSSAGVKRPLTHSSEALLRKALPLPRLWGVGSLTGPCSCQHYTVTNNTILFKDRNTCLIASVLAECSEMFRTKQNFSKEMFSSWFTWTVRSKPRSIRSTPKCASHQSLIFEEGIVSQSPSEKANTPFISLQQTLTEYLACARNSVRR